MLKPNINEFILEENCFNCGKSKDCLIISCCHSNSEPICSKCAYYLRFQLVKNMKCPKCNYEIIKREMVSEFYQQYKYKLNEKNSNYRSGITQCLICEKNKDQIEEIDCCEKLQKVCLNCILNSLSCQKCMFCEKVFNVRLKEILMNKSNSPKLNKVNQESKNIIAIDQPL